MVIRRRPVWGPTVLPEMACPDKPDWGAREASEGPGRVSLDVPHAKQASHRRLGCGSTDVWASLLDHMDAVHGGTRALTGLLAQPCCPIE
eukprot:9501435-Pyramimonas_sp.AAC.2